MGMREEETGSMWRTEVAQIAQVRVEVMISIVIVNEAFGKGAGRRRLPRMTE